MSHDYKKEAEELTNSDLDIYRAIRAKLQGGKVQSLTERIESALIEAEKKGFERAREQAVKICEDNSNNSDFADSYDARDQGGDLRARYLANQIRGMK